MKKKQERKCNKLQKFFIQPKLKLLSIIFESTKIMICFNFISLKAC